MLYTEDNVMLLYLSPYAEISIRGRDVILSSRLLGTRITMPNIPFDKASDFMRVVTEGGFTDSELSAYIRQLYPNMKDIEKLSDALLQGGILE